MEEKALTFAQGLFDLTPPDALYAGEGMQTQGSRDQKVPLFSTTGEFILAR
jgi:hypothetical protein